MTLGARKPLELLFLMLHMTLQPWEYKPGALSIIERVFPSSVAAAAEPSVTVYFCIALLHHVSNKDEELVFCVYSFN